MIQAKYKKYSFLKKLFIVMPLLYCFSLSFAETPAISYYKQAKDSFSKYNYFQAITLLQKSLKENPYYFDAKLLLGDSYFQIGNYDSAFNTFAECQKMSPNNPQVLLKLAKAKIALAHSKQDLIGARFYLEKAYALAPRDPGVIATFGEYFFSTGNYAKAMSYYNMLGDDSPDITIHLNKAKVYEKYGQNENELKELKKAEVINNNSYEVLLALGNYYEKMHDYASAVTYFNAAQKVNTGDKKVLFSLSKMYMDKKDFSQASLIINNLIKEDPKNPVAYYFLGICFNALGEFDKSISILQQGIAYNQNNEFLRIKAEELAIKELPLGSPVRKTLATFYNNKATDLKDLGEELTPEASFYLKRSLRINPLSVSVRVALANFYRKQGYIYEYLKILKSGLFLDPKNEKLNDAYTLNQKFTLNTLEAKNNNMAVPPIPLDPVFSIDDVVMANDSNYPYFEDDVKTVLLEKLLNTHSINAFIRTPATQNTPSDYGIRLIVTPKEEKIEINAEILDKNSKSIFKTYSFTEYGTDKLLSGLTNITKAIKRDIPIIGRIVKVNTDTAIINLGAEQGVKKGTLISIYSEQNQLGGIPIYHFNTPLWKIATGTITEIGENIAEVSFKALDSVVFNMVQQNQLVFIEKTLKKGNK